MWTEEVTNKYEKLIGAFRNFANAPKNCGESDIRVLGIEEEASEVLHLEHSFIWC